MIISDFHGIILWELKMFVQLFNYGDMHINGIKTMFMIEIFSSEMKNTLFIERDN